MIDDFVVFLHLLFVSNGTHFEMVGHFFLVVVFFLLFYSSAVDILK